MFQQQQQKKSGGGDGGRDVGEGLKAYNCHHCHKYCQLQTLSISLLYSSYILYIP